MTIITNSEAKTIIESHLSESQKMLEVLFEPSGGISHDDWFESCLKHIETHLDIMWYLTEKYMDVTNPVDVNSIYREKLIIRYTFNNLKNKTVNYKTESIALISFLDTYKESL